jgi:IS66 Orf2 like protein
VALGRTRLRQGHSVNRIARELGISEPTLAGWLRTRGPSILRPVAVAPGPAPTRTPGFVLIAAPGVRVEGLDRDTLIAVLRALVWIGSTRQVAVWAYGAPADLRKGVDGLSALVTHTLEWDPLSGDCYLACASTRSAWNRAALRACGGRRGRGACS